MRQFSGVWPVLDAVKLSPVILTPIPDWNPLSYFFIHGAFQDESRLQNFFLKIQQHGNQNKYNSKKFKKKKTLKVSRDQAVEGTEICICALNSRVLAKDKD